VAKTAERSATYEDLLKVPDDRIAELVDGELFTSPRPAGRHSRALSVVHARIHRAFDSGDGGPGGWWIAVEPELHLGGDVLVPDIAGWRRERVPEYDPGAFWDTEPDWICEVLSPFTGRLDRIRKLPNYATHQVGHAWLIDPVQQTLEVFRLAEGRWLLVAAHEGDDTVRAEPFDAIDVPLAELWLPA
jgi:Uma2 family endonuclease